MSRAQQFMIPAAGAGGAAVTDADAAAYIDAMVVAPDGTRKNLIDQLFIDLKAAGVYALLDEAWLFASHTAQAGLLGLKRLKDCTNVNSAAFVADRGYTGNETTSYLNTNFVPSTDGVNYTQDSASFGVYSRTNVLSAIGNDFGSQDTVGFTNLASRVTGDASNARVNTATAQSIGSQSDSRGLLAVRRSSSSAQDQLRNGTSIGSVAISSDGLSTYVFFICCRNDADTPTAFSPRQYAFAFVGAAMSDPQQASLYSIIQAYLTEIGANF